MSSNVEQIKSRLNITEVVQSYVKLQKAGANLKANCPFHMEKTPSFFVSPARESWHCFGCGRGGDMFSFIMEIEGVEFVEALKILANRAGIELQKTDLKEKNERVRLIQLMEDAKAYFENELKKKAEVIEYLKKRGMKGETAKSFGVGFAPEGWRNLRDYLKSKGYADQEMEKAGMVIKPSYYDRFRNRIMFPIANGSGEIVGFSGRIFGPETAESGGKYINTPQTVLYDKSKILYGFDKAKNEIRKKDLCILVEGQMDVIMSHQIGLENTVAVSGTALTHEHLKLIKRLTQNLVAAFDKDTAGLNATERAVSMALAEQFEVKIALSPAGKDPADAALENPTTWIKAVESAKNTVEFYLELFSGSKDIEKKVLPYVLSMPSEMDKAHWVKKISDKLKIKEEAVWAELKKAKLPYDKSAQKEEESSGAKTDKKTRLKMLKNRFAGLILWQNKSGSAETKELAAQLARERESEMSDMPEEEKNALIFEAELFFSGAQEMKGEINKLKRELEKEEIKYNLEAITQKIKELENFTAEKAGGGKEAQLQKYLNEFHELTRKLNKL